MEDAGKMIILRSGVIEVVLLKWLMNFLVKAIKKKIGDFCSSCLLSPNT